MRLASFLLVGNAQAEAMIRTTKEIGINIPVEEVFNFVADYANTPRYTEPLVTFKPTTKIERGNGVQFDMAGESFGIPFQSQLEVANFAKNRSWHLKLISGTQIKIQWLFRSKEKGTRVTYMIEYRLPFGLMGRVIDNLIIRRLTDKGMEKTL